MFYCTIFLLHRSVGDRFNVDKSVVEACFQRVVKALNYVKQRFIQWPTENGTFEQVKYKKA